MCLLIEIFKIYWRFFKKIARIRRNTMEPAREDPPKGLDKAIPPLRFNFPGRFYNGRPVDEEPAVFVYVHL